MPFYVPPARGKAESSVTWVEPMSGRARLSCVILIFIGLLTFFSPSISTDTPVLGRSEWSPFEILKHIHAGALPVRDDFSYSSRSWITKKVVIGISFHCLLLVVSLVLVLIPSWPEFVIPSVIWGALLHLGVGRGHGLGGDLQGLFYGSRGHWLFNPLVHTGQYRLLLLIVHALLLGVLFADIANRKRPIPYASSTGLRDVENLEAILAAKPDDGRAKKPSED